MTWARTARVAAVGLALLLAGAGAARTQTPVTIDEDAWLRWLAEFRAEALSIGFPPAVVDEALDGIRPVVRVIELDRKQPEFTLTVNEYFDRIIPDFRVHRARDRYAEHRDLLDRIAAESGVSAGIIVSLWGIETDFGRLTGGFKAIPALATLAFDGRRSAYFRRELFGALQIAFEGHKLPAEMSSSWAGAMGQIQLMPTSFLAYAVDDDGDGRRDVWTNPRDVFATAANFLATEGWRPGEPWGYEVSLPQDFGHDLGGLGTRMPGAEWAARGVRLSDGGALPDLPASILIPDDVSGRAFIVFENFRNILKWNRANYFALAVGLLADRIEDR